MKKTFNIKGMHCKSCEMIIKEGLSELDGIKNVEASSIKNNVIVDFDDKKLSDAKIKKAIEQEGYKVVS